MEAMHELGDLSFARRIYYNQILPVVDMVAKNNNPTGTIKAGVAARGVEVGIPRRPGSGVNAVDQERLAALVRRIEQLERETDLLLNRTALAESHGDQQL
jgi:dihydrodipicolinate synthase/N-acetylneuraminate lyase